MRDQQTNKKKPLKYDWTVDIIFLTFQELSITSSLTAAAGTSSVWSFQLFRTSFTFCCTSEQGRGYANFSSGFAF